MDLALTSADGTVLHAEVSGAGATAVVFAHGWLGNLRWWDAQRDALVDDYTVVQLDLAGHGRSARTRTAHSISAYADDIVAAASAVDAERVVLVGHSMSGAHAAVAATRLPRARMLILADTLKDLDVTPPPAQVAQILDGYRHDFVTTVRTIMGAYLFASTTPPAVRARVEADYLAHDGAAAVELLAPLYRDDYHSAVRALAIPVRAVNGDLQPTNLTSGRAWFGDFAAQILPGVGHFPMLEAPEAFNRHLRAALAELSGGRE